MVLFSPAFSSRVLISLPQSPLVFFSPPPLQSSNLLYHPSIAQSSRRKCSRSGQNGGFAISSSTPDACTRSNVHTCDEGIDVDFVDTIPMIEWVEPDLLVLWLRSCQKLRVVKMIHAVVLKCLFRSTVYVSNNMINVYLEFGRLTDARKVFDGLSHRKSVVSWTAMLNGYTNFGLHDDAMNLLVQIIDTEVRPNSKTFVCMLNLCGKRSDYELGKQIHGLIVKRIYSNLIVDSAIISFYAHSGDLVGSFQAFNRMQERDVVSWTALITACMQQGCQKLSFSLFCNMLSAGYRPNEHTICSVLKACGEENVLRFGRQLHSLAVKKLIKNDIYVETSLVDMYAKCRQISDSRKVFYKMRKQNMVTWTSMIAGYTTNGLGFEALELFRMMKRRKVVANDLTIVSILRACGSVGALSSGKEVHAQIIKNSVQHNIYVDSTLVWFYFKCGFYALALRILQATPNRDVVSWTALISGCAQHGQESEALELLKEMMGEGVQPNPFTYSSILKACAKLEDVKQGRLIHSSLRKSPASSHVFVGSALIHMYAKCGYLSEAFQVFEKMPERNIVAWRAMIVGCAMNGHCKEALRLMYRMRAEGFEVDDYMLTTVLTACGDAECDSVEPSFSLLSFQPS